jgi:HPt (histidine-containing phosphotransfer) domain-containing protein
MVQADANAECIYSPLARDPDFGDIVGMFVEEIPGRVASMLDRLSKGDWSSLQQSAHQLKGAAGSYGFAPISPCAGRLERVIRDGEPEERIREAVMELIDLCGRIRRGQPPLRG